MYEFKTYYRRHLPHYQPEYATFHVVFRLAGSLPGRIIEELKREKDNSATKNRKIYNQKYFDKYDNSLNITTTGPAWLKEDSIASLISKAIHFRDKTDYDLLAYCIMPNHVHILFELQKEHVSRLAESTKTIIGRDCVSIYIVTKIIGSLKKYTAIRANRILKRSGSFWQHESYDHVVRTGEELENTIWYVLFNPVKAGMVKEWNQWKWSYCREDLINMEKYSLMIQ
jgi:putative transposase